MTVGLNKFCESAAAACVLVLLMQASHAASVTDPRTVADCRRISDQSARLACYDRIPDNTVPAPAITAPVAPAPAVAAPTVASPTQAAAPVAPQPAPIAQQPAATSAPVAAGAPAQPAASAPPASAPPATAPTTTSEASRYGLPKGPEPKEVKAIEVEVASTGMSPLGKLRITTADGMVWEQTIGTPAKPPAVGSKITISDSAMGGHWCEINRWTAVRCRRVQ